MANVTIVSKIRFLAGIAPAILLIVSPILALAFLEFGNVPSTLRDEQLTFATIDTRAERRSNSLPAWRADYKSAAPVTKSIPLLYES